MTYLSIVTKEVHHTICIQVPLLCNSEKKFHSERLLTWKHKMSEAVVL